MHPIRTIINLFESFTLDEATIERAIAELYQNIDWGGGGGETVAIELAHYGYDIGELGAFEQTDPTFLAAFHKWAYHRIDEAFGEIDYHITGGTIQVWREITAPRNWTPAGRHPGGYWSYEKDAAEAHFGSFTSGHVKWLIEAVINVRDIDWVSTLAANANPDVGNEKEITLAGERPVHIVSYVRV